MFKICLVTDRKHVPHNKKLTGIIKEAVESGVEAVFLREKDLSGLELFNLAKEIKNITKNKAYFLINSRTDIALAVDADGVHLGFNSIPVTEARKLLGKRKLIGASCHSVSDVVKRTKEGVNYVFLGPMFFTASKAKYGKPLGPEVIKEVKKISRVPVIAIGGIKESNVLDVLSAGADGVAMITELICAKSISCKVKKIKELLNGVFR